MTKRPKPIVQRFGGLTCISRTGEPTDPNKLWESLNRALKETKVRIAAEGARPPRGPEKSA